MEKTYTRRDISRKTGIAVTTLEKYFVGKRQRFSNKNIKLLSEYLELPEQDVRDLINTARKIELKLNPYKKHLYQNGTFKRIKWSRGDVISKDMFEDILSTYKIDLETSLKNQH